jgi:hypothetical protein
MTDTLTAPPKPPKVPPPIAIAGAPQSPRKPRGGHHHVLRRARAE